MDVVDKFGEGDYRENKARKASTSTKKPIGADHLSANHASHTVTNLVSKNISKYLT